MGPEQALKVVSATLGVLSACYGLAASAQRYRERCERANSPVGRFKRMLGMDSY